MSNRPFGIAACVLTLLTAAIILTGMSTTACEYQSSHSRTDLGGALPGDETLEEVWDYWQHEDLKGLDPWGDTESRAMDIVAVYEKEEPDFLRFRLDFLDLPTEMITPTHFALDFVSGGSTVVEPGNVTITFDVEWDLMVSISGTSHILYDSTFVEHPDLLADVQVDRQLDFVAFGIARDAFAGWDGGAFQMQALAAAPGNMSLLDKIAPVETDDSTGRAKLVLPFANYGNYQAPYEINVYDGFGFRPDERPGERRGVRYIMDAAEKYNIPFALRFLRIETLPGLEYLRINDRIRDLAGRGLFEPMAGLGYGHFMAWQPDDIDARAIDLASELRQDLDIPASTVFYPYEAMIAAGDIQVIQDAGFEAIYGLEQYRYWFGWIEDWSDPEAVQAEFETWRKVHLINGMPFVFDNRIGNYMLGAVADERWDEINWNEYSEYKQFEGTDQGLDLWWRTILHDMALDLDQEQFFVIGTDIDLTAWIFADAVDWNFRWLASHPWIEVTTFSNILGRGWAAIDHGDLGLADDELLMQYLPDEDCGYNAYFPEHYYGGITDDRCPTIPPGLEIEAYYDYVPYLRDGALIHPPRIMGDDQTPGSVIYETLQNLRAAPDNPLTDLAWLSYLMHIAEQTWHDGTLLGDRAKLQANLLLQVNKIVFAANWADEAARGNLPQQAQVIEQDLDLDGENEYVLSNDSVLAIFENDGGRLEYAFAYDAQYGPVQLVSPSHQYFFKPESEYGFDYTNGEVALLLPPSWCWRPDGAFIDSKPGYDCSEYAPYLASYTSGSLSFELESFPLTKTFTLEGDTIRAEYVIGAGEESRYGFQPSVNRRGVFTRDWPDAFEEVIRSGALGWQMTTGGLALVHFEDAEFGDRFAFSDSPARDEMQEREDESTYPPGHYMGFPFSMASLYGAGNESLSLTLRASPIHRVFLPVVVKED